MLWSCSKFWIWHGQGIWPFGRNILRLFPCLRGECDCCCHIELFEESLFIKYFKSRGFCSCSWRIVIFLAFKYPCLRTITHVNKRRLSNKRATAAACSWYKICVVFPAWHLRFRVAWNGSKRPSFTSVTYRINSAVSSDYRSLIIASNSEHFYFLLSSI